MGSFARSLGIPLSEIQRVESLPNDQKYRKPKTPAFKSDGTERKIMTPVRALRSIQHRINKRIFKPHIKWPSYLFGSIPNIDKSIEPQDYISAASQHCECKSICKLDVSNFFDNIHKDYIQAVFEGLFRFDAKVSATLTNLVTYENNLVQGALTSSYIALLVLYDKEPHVVKRLKRQGITYTRLVDDITLSSSIHNFDFSLAIKIVEEMLNEKELVFNKDKLVTSSISTDFLTVHGLNVSFNIPCLPKNEAKRIRANVRFIENLVKSDSIRTEQWYRQEYNRCLGRVYKLQRFGKVKSFNNLKSRLEKIAPTASLKDVRYTKSRVSKLEADYQSTSKAKSYNYMRRYSIASHRVAFLKDKFREQSEALRKRLKKIAPLYEL